MTSTKEQKVRKQRRQFFTGVSLVLISLGVWNVFKERPAGPVLLTIGGVLLTIEYLFEALSRILFKGWMGFAHILGRINTTILLSLIYFLLMAPLAFIRRKANKQPDEAADYLKRRSAWVPIEDTSQSIENYLRPY